MSSPLKTIRAYLYILTLAFALIFSTAESYAQSVDQQGAESLKTHIQELMKLHTDIKKIAGETYEWEGDVIVEPSGSYYAVTLPYLKIKKMSGVKVDVGMFAVNAIPSSKYGQWKVAVAIPTPIKVFDKLGTLMADISIGKQRMAGIWAEDAANFLKLDAAFENFVAKDGEGTPLFTAPKITMKNDFTISGKDVWSGPYGVAIHNGQIKVEKESFDASFKEMFIRGSVKNFEIKLAENLQKAFQDISNEMDEEGVTMESSAGLAKVEELGGAMVDYLANFGADSDVEIGVNGLKVNYLAPETDTPQSFSLDELAFDFIMKDLDKKLSTIGFGINVAGVDQPDDSLLRKTGKDLTFAKDYIPSDFSFNIALENFPYSDFFGMGANIIKDAAAQGPEANPMMQIMAKIPELNKMLSDAKMAITTKETAVSSDLYNVTVDTNMVFTPTSPLQFVGQSVISIKGMSDVMAKMNQQMQDAQAGGRAQEQAELQQLIGGLTMVQMFGQAQQSPDGKSLHVYKIELTQDGQTLLNGNDLGAITGMGAGAPQGQGQPQAVPQ